MNDICILNNKNKFQNNYAEFSYNIMYNVPIKTLFVIHSLNHKIILIYFFLLILHNKFYINCFSIFVKNF